jgi:hypothetical protein
MAAALTTTSTSQEQQVLEILTRTRKDVSDYILANPTADLQGFSVSNQIDLANNQATFVVVMPINISEDADGGISIDATEVLV